MSGSTVGFGDFTPSSPQTKTFIIFYLPILICLTALVFSELFQTSLSLFVDVSVAELNAFQRKLNSLLEKTQNLTKLDTDGDGSVTELEFMFQALINEYEVPPEKIRMMRCYFRELIRKTHASRRATLRLPATRSKVKGPKTSRELFEPSQRVCTVRFLICRKFTFL